MKVQILSLFALLTLVQVGVAENMAALKGINYKSLENYSFQEKQEFQERATSLLQNIHKAFSLEEQKTEVTEASEEQTQSNIDAILAAEKAVNEKIKSLDTVDESTWQEKSKEVYHSIESLVMMLQEKKSDEAGLESVKLS